MKELTNKEMLEVTGGIKAYVGAIIAGVVTFILGIIDGYSNPKSCNR